MILLYFTLNTSIVDVIQGDAMLNTRIIARLFMLLVLVSVSCDFATGLVGGGDGPANFTAALTAPDVVSLRWDTVEGATGYILELSMDDGESIPIVGLPAEYTSYEDLSAPQKSKLTYQIQVLTQAGPAGKSKVEIETGERTPNPLTVQPTYDEENAVAVTVGVRGGNVSLIDSNGVEYALAIPEGALSVDTEIRMTAISTIEDWPLDGNAIGGVRLEPEGLVLNDVAILTMGIPVDIEPDLALVGFAFEVDGQEFHLQPSDQEKGQTNTLPFAGTHLARPVFQQPKHIVRLPVMELKVGGVGQTTEASVSDIVKNNAPSDAGDALEQKWAAEAIADDELAPLENTKGWKPSPRARMEAQEIAKEFANANDCGELTGLMGSFQIWRNTIHYVELTDDQRSVYTRQIWDELSDKIKEVLEKTAGDCVKSNEPGGPPSPDSPCAKALLEKIITPLDTRSNFWHELKDKMENKLSDQELQDIKDKLEKCKPKAYHIAGGHFDVEGDACDITKPFTIGGGVVMSFTPSDASSGGFEYSNGPFDANGGGTYTGGNGIMTLAITRGCIESPLGEFCNVGTDILSMTPIDPATCGSQ